MDLDTQILKALCPFLWCGAVLRNGTVTCCPTLSVRFAKSNMHEFSVRKSPPRSIFSHKSLATIKLQGNILFWMTMWLFSVPTISIAEPFAPATVREVWSILSTKLFGMRL